jgi:hypothetical protein
VHTDAVRMRWYCLFVLAAVGGCTGGTPAGAPAPAPRSSPAADAVGCVDATAEDAAMSGNVRAGPFALNRGQWTAPAGAKLWVGSTHRPEAPTGAVIRAVRSDGAGQPVVVRRGPEQIGVVDTLPVFYPGLIRLPTPGRWRLDVSVGRDRGCFLLTV